MGKQTLDKKGQPIIVPDKDCPHGVSGDDRGNNACEECYENSSTSSYLLGIAVGYEELSANFAKRAGEAYAAGNDSRAQFFRELSRELTATAVEKREKVTLHDVEYPHGPEKK
jgi:hypothetical protein